MIFFIYVYNIAFLWNMRFFNPAFLSNIEFSISDMLDMTIIIWDLWLKLLIPYWTYMDSVCFTGIILILLLSPASSGDARCERSMRDAGPRKCICIRWTWDGVGWCSSGFNLTVAFAADRLPSLRFEFGSYRIWFYNNNFFLFLWNVMKSEARDAHRWITSVSDLSSRVCNRSRCGWVRLVSWVGVHSLGIHQLVEACKLELKSPH